MSLFSGAVSSLPSQVRVVFPSLFLVSYLSPGKETLRPIGSMITVSTRRNVDYDEISRFVSQWAGNVTFDGYTPTLDLPVIPSVNSLTVTGDCHFAVSRSGPRAPGTSSEWFCWGQA